MKPRTTWTSWDAGKWRSLRDGNQAHCHGPLAGGADRPCGQRRQALLADDRADEATFEKIRANVYDIFRTVLSVAARTCGEKDAAGRFFRQRMESIPSGWAASWEKARQHDDAVRLRQEQVKLDTVGEIRRQFEEVWEGAE